MKRKICAAFLCMTICLSALSKTVPLQAMEEPAEIPQMIDRYEQPGSDAEIQTAALEEEQGLSADIQKRVSWTDAEKGTAEIELSYRSNSGSFRGTHDMNIILIQDKSGSMDSNYGLKVQMEKEGLSVSDCQQVRYFPIRNEQEWSEAAEEIVASSGYTDALNGDTNGINKGKLYSYETRYNSPCQMEDHYYLLAADESVSGSTKGTFVHGNNLYQIYQTDLHHYRKLRDREEAVAYLEQGRRVIRAKTLLGPDGQLQQSEDQFYFLDISKILTFHGNTYLSTVDTECEKNDRLARSQGFMEGLVTQIERYNQNNKIAYIPFWGDVPQDGSWKNLSYNKDTQQLFEDTYVDAFSYKEGVTNIGFTESSQFGTILQQIRNPFTYNGTNWARALEKAVSFLETRKQEDLQKDTLILFLTDGMPQGFAGKPEDVNVALINGEDQIAKLKKISGVSLYTVGVCINQSDAQTTQRLDRADSSGKAFFARTTDEFDSLLEKIVQRIAEQYVVQIEGTDAFYTDVLEEDFALEEESLDSSWRVVQTADASLKKGVPQNVYDIMERDPQIACVYVKSTKTVYWKIGTMTDGTYSAEGHQISFPVRYEKYDEPTGGRDKNISANSMQKLTYVSTADPTKLLSLSMETPRLVFNRQPSPSMTIIKQLEGKTYAQDRTFLFAVCREKQSQSVKTRERSVEVEIKAGNTSGQTDVEDLQPGTYYVYETDAAGKIKNDVSEIQIKNAGQEGDGTVILSAGAHISTLAKGGSVQSSAVSSDGAVLDNKDNYLKVTSDHAEILFKEYAQSGEIKVVKTIRADDDAVWWEHGEPIFIVRVSGEGNDGNEYTFYHTFRFTEDHVRQNTTKEGLCRMEYTFEEIPLGKSYKIEEVCSQRYRLGTVTGNGDNVQVIDSPGEKNGYFSSYALVDLQQKAEGTVVELRNEKTNNQWYSHTAYIRNQIWQ